MLLFQLINLQLSTSGQLFSQPAISHGGRPCFLRSPASRVSSASRGCVSSPARPHQHHPSQTNNKTLFSNRRVKCSPPLTRTISTHSTPSHRLSCCPFPAVPLQRVYPDGVCALTEGFTLVAYVGLSMASSPMKKSRSSTPLSTLLWAWSTTFADSLMAIPEGNSTNCPSPHTFIPMIKKG